MGCDEGIAIGDNWAGYLGGVTKAPKVATDGDPIVFDGEESGDFGNGELSPFRSFSKEVELERFFTSLVARAIYLIAFGTEGEEGVVASVATEEAEISLLAHFMAEATAFGSSNNLFFVDLRPWVFTILG